MVQLMPRLQQTLCNVSINISDAPFCSGKKADYSVPGFFYIQMLIKYLIQTAKTERITLFSLQSESRGGIILALTINSAQTPANENLSGNQTVFCLILVINEVAALHLASKATRFTGHVELELTLHLSGAS